MITVVTNLSEVRASLAKFAGGLDAAVRKAFEPKAWRPIARAEALTTLTVLAERGEKKFVRRFADAVTTAAFPQGMEWELDAMGQALSEALVERFQESARDPDLFSTTRDEITAALVAEWVRTEKSKDHRDRNLDGSVRSDAEITERLLAILFAKQRNKNRDAAARNLIFGDTHTHGKSLLEFARAKDGSETLGLSAATAERWLEAVLEAWSERLLEEMPGRIREEVDKLWKQIKN